MSRLERLKEEIAFEKQAFFLLFAAGLGIVGWIFTHAQEVEPYLLYFAGGAEIADALLLAYLKRRITEKFEELEKL